MSDLVPEGWEIKRLKDLGKCVRGLTYSPENIVNDGLLVLRSSNIQNDRFSLMDTVYVDVDVPKEFLTQTSDILICVRNGSKRLLGKSVYIQGDRPQSTHGAFMTVFRSNMNEFIQHHFKSDQFFIQVSRDIGATINSINTSNLLEYKFPIPPLPEQKKIAAILTSVDDVIETTQRQIDKLQDLKKATMNELLTKGIGHTEFKDSELGRIPKSWDVVLLDDVVTRGSGHTPNKQISEYWNDGIKWVSLADSFRLDRGFIDDTDKEISGEGLKNSSAVLHPKGTVVLSRDAGIGKSAILKHEMAVSQHFIAWRCDHRMDSWFLYYLMQNLKPTFENIAMGSTIKTIGLGFFKKMKIAYPNVVEQQNISERLLSIDVLLRKLRLKLTQTQSLKKSLMQDLLTGKVRVKVN